MGTQRLVLTSTQYEALRLRSITAEDLELLRRWKNLNKNRFFHQDTISARQQEAWYQGFCKRANDFMFIIEEKSPGGYCPIGCAGFRIIEGAVDIYNVIRGNKSRNADAKISDALGIMCGYIRSVTDKVIGCVVLADNPALGWYQSIGFAIRTKGDNSVGLELDEIRFRDVHLTVGGGAR